MCRELDVAELERRGWEALSKGPGDARAFFEGLVADDAQMLLPGGLRLVGRERILETMGGRPWESFELTDVQVLDLSRTARAVTYEVVAHRTGSGAYRAFICSVYACRAGEWRLVVHQHTPV